MSLIQLLLVVICLFTYNALAQVQFQKLYGETGTNKWITILSGQQTSDGGYIATGTATPPPYLNGQGLVVLIKTDVSGNLQWSKTYGGTQVGEYGLSVRQTSDGGYIITGYTSSFGAGGRDVYLIKTDGTGNLQWSKTFGGANDEWGQSVQQTNDGGYIITGWTLSFGADGSDILLIKTDGSGNLQWSKTYGGTGNERGQDVKQTNDGGYIITGWTSSFGAGVTDLYLLKTDGNGNLQWSNTFGGAQSETGYSVQQTSDGGFIATGCYAGGPGVGDVYLIKTDGNGNLQWSNSFGGAANETGQSVLQTSDGGYLITGVTQSFGVTNYDIYTIKTDGSGNLQWSKIYGQGVGISSNCYYAQQTTDGGYIMIGYSFLGSNNPNFYLIKTDQNGNSLNCNTTIPSTSVVTPVTLVSSGGIENSVTPTISTPATLVNIPAIPETTLCNPTVGSICGVKFNDVNNNCVMDASEQGLSGWTINLSGSAIQSTTTNSLGEYCFTSLQAGTYTVSEVQQNPWVQTCPTPSGTYTINLSAGQNATDINFGNHTCIQPPQGMIGWWPLDELAGATLVNDIAPQPSSMVNNFGVPQPGGSVGIPNGPTPVSGMVEGALYFTGKYVEVPQQSELDLGTDDFSIDVWVKPADCSHGGGGVLSPIVDKFNGTAGFSFYLDQPNIGVANLYLNINGSSFMSSGTLPTLGSSTWSHIAVVVQHNPAVGTFYINGVSSGTFTPPSGTLTNTLPLWIGKIRVSANNQCEIALDELELFSRALIPQEIADIYNAASAGKCKPIIDGIEYSVIPNDYIQLNSYPNPFSHNTTIEYRIPYSGFVKLTVFDVLGNEINVLVNEFEQEGSHKVIFYANDVPAGVYTYRLQTGQFQKTRSLILIK